MDGEDDMLDDVGPGIVVGRSTITERERETHKCHQTQASKATRAPDTEAVI